MRLMVSVVAFLSGVFIVGCAGPGVYTWVDELPATTPGPPLVHLKPGDAVQVRVWRQDELSADTTIRADGNITMPLLGDVAIGGLTPDEAAGQVSNRIKSAELMVDPKVSVGVVSLSAMTVTVLGEVRAPGRFALEPGDNLLHVLGQAGGLTEFADDDGVYVVRKSGSPERVRFSYRRLCQADGNGLHFQLLDGDVVVVEP